MISETLFLSLFKEMKDVDMSQATFCFKEKERREIGIDCMTHMPNFIEHGQKKI